MHRMLDSFGFSPITGVLSEVVGCSMESKKSAITGRLEGHHLNVTALNTEKLLHSPSALLANVHVVAILRLEAMVAAHEVASCG